MARKIFGKKRGRPKKSIETYDRGTPELQRKRAQGETAEIIDRYLATGVILEAHHRAALHFRWLYTLRYGCPTVKAMNLLGIACTSSTQNDPQQKALYEEQYRLTVLQLEAAACESVVMDCVVHNQAPANPSLSIPKLQEGLEMLRQLFMKTARQHKKASP